MTKIDFYTGSTDKLRTACQLSHKAMQSGIRTILGTPDAATTEALDKLLWHYPATAFIPHQRHHADVTEHMLPLNIPPVLLSQEQDKFPHHDLLINLRNECMTCFSRFERVIEITTSEPEDSQMARLRFKFYRDRGYELRHIDLRQKA